MKIKRKASRGTKGILLSNPVVAAQVGAAAGSLLAAMYVENPDILKNLEPIVDIYGRTREREDVIAYVRRTATTANGQTRANLHLLVANLRAATHEGEGKASYKAALDRQIASLQEMLGVQEWTRNDKKETR